jgi:RNA polymerase sigma-70 factor (ECF subfamily)
MQLRRIVTPRLSSCARAVAADPRALSWPIWEVVLSSRVPRPQNQTESHAGPSDAALVVAARAGEKWAQEALFRRHARMVNGLAFRLMGRDEDVDDLVQDSFLSALRGLDGLASPQAFSSWLCSIVVRSAHKLLRRRRLMTRVGLRRSTPLDLEQVISPAAPAHVCAELKLVYGHLEQLEPEVRIALVLHRIDGLSLPDVAEQMRLSVSTVKRRLSVAERMLSQLGGLEGRLE